MKIAKEQTGESMRSIVLAARVGDWLIVREGSQAQRRYRVTESSGPPQSRVLMLRGVNGAERKLIDAVDHFALQREVGDGKTEARRIADICIDDGKIDFYTAPPATLAEAMTSAGHDGWTGSTADAIRMLVAERDQAQAERDQARAGLHDAVEWARVLLRALPADYHGHDRAMSDTDVDEQGRYVHNGFTGISLASVAVVAATGWIEALDLALGQVRSLARTGELGTEPMTSQDSRQYEASGRCPALARATASPDSVILDVAVELARLARLNHLAGVEIKKW